MHLTEYMIHLVANDKLLLFTLSFLRCLYTKSKNEMKKTKKFSTKNFTLHVLPNTYSIKVDNKHVSVYENLYIFIYLKITYDSNIYRTFYLNIWNFQIVSTC